MCVMTYAHRMRARTPHELCPPLLRKRRRAS